MIPKIIYYVWLGDEIPKLLADYIKGCMGLMPDYEFRLIGNDNYPHSEFTDWAIKNKRWALASNYIRCQLVYESGGIYLDTDMETVKRFDDLLDNECFVGREDINIINCAVIGAVKGNEFLKKCLDYLDNIDKGIKKIELETAPLMFTKLIDDTVKVYSEEYFYPYRYTAKFTPECVTENTYTVHHWTKLW